MTKLYISSLDQNFRDLNTKIVHKSKYVLATYYYLRQKTNNHELMNIIAEYNRNKRLIIDSGAFSFMNGKTITEQKLDDYCADYVSFLKKYSINYFVEMDIDSVLGFDKAMQYRTYIEQSLNKQCIPIFHKSRGKSEFVKMVNDYSYAGIGGIAIKDIKPNEWKHFKQLNLFANKHGCRLHAMGFTPSKNLNDYGFYSSDSSSWTMGVRFGNLYRFDGQSIKSIKKPPHSRLVLQREQIQQFNWNEWCKYQKFVDK